MARKIKDTLTEPMGWSEYMPEQCTLPYMHAHLTNMSFFIDNCQRYFGGKRILEIGTGTGIIAVYFSQIGYEVTGLDYEFEIVRRNQVMGRQFGSKADFLQGDMFALPFPEGSFDAGYHQGLMEHFDEEDIVRSIKHQADICRRVIFTVPTSNWKGGVRGDERMWLGAYWRDLLSDLNIVHVFGSAYTGVSARALHVLNRKFLRGRPAGLYQRLALQHAGEIGFVLERRNGHQTP